MYHLHDYPNASAAFQVVVQRWPDDPLAAQSLLAMGTIYGELGQYDKAIEPLRLLIAKFPQDPHLPQAKLWIAHNLVWLKQFAQALAQYGEAATTGSPVLAEARYYRGYCQMMLKEYDQAIETLGQVVAADADATRVVRAHYYLACCHYGKKNFDAAIAELDKILAGNSPPYVQSHPAALYFKADCYHSAGRHDAARTTAEELLSRFPDSSYADPARLLLEAIRAATSS
jgi:tetratricopeptide (TPR) repeat protein